MELFILNNFAVAQPVIILNDLILHTFEKNYLFRFVDKWSHFSKLFWRIRPYKIEIPRKSKALVFSPLRNRADACSEKSTVLLVPQPFRGDCNATATANPPITIEKYRTIISLKLYKKIKNNLDSIWFPFYLYPPKKTLDIIPSDE